MNKNIIIVAGEPYSVFLELLFKSIKTKKINKPFLLICSKNLLVNQMKRLNYNFKINNINKSKCSKTKLLKKHINILDVSFNFKKTFDKISEKSFKYIEDCFKEGLNLTKNKDFNILVNGPISKKYFLKKKFLGITEYVAKKTGNKGNEVMLIYNNKLSVSPVTTHLPLAEVKKKYYIKKNN